MGKAKLRLKKLSPEQRSIRLKEVLPNNPTDSTVKAEKSGKLESKKRQVPMMLLGKMYSRDQ